MGTNANLVRGHAHVFVDVSGTLTPIGHTLGGTDVEIGAPIYAWMKTDDTGETEIEPVRNGCEPDYVTLRFAEETYDNLQKVIDGLTLVTDAVDVTKKREDRLISAGGAPTAYKLVIKPIDPATGVPYAANTKWLTIPRAIPSGSVNVMFKTGEQRIFEQRFRAVVEQLASGAYRSFYYGDGTAVAA